MAGFVHPNRPLRHHGLYPLMTVCYVAFVSMLSGTVWADGYSPVFILEQWSGTFPVIKTIGAGGGRREAELVL